MISKATKDFWKEYGKLPDSIQQLARKSFKLFQTDPSHPSLHFKKVHEDPIVFSARVSIQYRALGVRQDDFIIWFWIGNHDQYQKLINSF
jgi:hypothetical protein